MPVPNIIHFIYLNREITKPFLFVHYLSIMSAKLVNNPDTIYFYYHAELYGEWWDRVKQFLTLERIELPTSIGDKAITKYEHMADVVKLAKLIERGGIYFDIDTISYRPYKELLNNDCVLCWEYRPYSICNAVIFAKPNSDFLKMWITNYPSHFLPDGWGEASIQLPAKLYEWCSQNNYMAAVNVLDSDYFFQPTHYEFRKILVDECASIPERLVTLHLWEKMCKDIIESIDIAWLHTNSHTLYSKLVLGNKPVADLLNQIANEPK
jgi:hypothetical protein